MRKDTGWDHALKVTGDGEGLVGHAGAVLLRKLADQAGLAGALGPALARAGKSPLIDRGIALVSMAVAIALGAASMTDVALLAQHTPVQGAGPSDTTVRRTLELADPRTLDKADSGVQPCYPNIGRLTNIGSSPGPRRAGQARHLGDLLGHLRRLGNPVARTQNSCNRSSSRAFRLTTPGPAGARPRRSARPRCASPWRASLDELSGESGPGRIACPAGRYGSGR